MPQIPLFNSTQRLEPGSPVAATSPESTAGNLAGAATQAFGNAMFNFGNLLDEAGRKSKNESDTYEAKILANNFKIAQVQARATIQAEAVNLKDDATGYDSVKRYQQLVNDPLEKLSASASSEPVRKMFLSQIGDDIARDSSVILADTVAKREKALPLMRQENLNGLASLGRSSYQVAQISAGQWEADILADTSMAPADKAAAIANGKKAIGKEAILGIIDNVSSMAGKPGAMANGQKFDEAEARLQKDWALVFTAEEKDKLAGEIRTARNAYYSTNLSILNQSEAMNKREREEANQKSQVYYYQQLANAGADQAKRNILITQVLADPTLDSEAKKALSTTAPIAFAEAANDNYQVAFQNKLYSGKFTTQKLLTEVNNAVSTGKIDNNRALQLQKQIHEKADRDEKNPNLVKQISSARDNIKAQFGISPLVVDDLLYKEVKGKQAAAALYAFDRKITAHYKNNTVNDFTITESMQDIFLRNNFPVLKPVRGAELPAYNDINAVDKAIKAAAEEYKRDGKNWSPAKEKEKTKRLLDLKSNRDQILMRDQNKLKTGPSSGGTVQGD